MRPQRQGLGLLVFGVTLLLLAPFNAASSASKEVAERTYKRLKGCLRFNRDYGLRYPDDAEEHYAELLRRTAQYRNQSIHRGSGGYTGTWIEDRFIAHFLDKPLSFFSGLFPLFVQWSDYGFAVRGRGLTHAQAFEPLRKFLRPNVLYLAVSQANSGLDFIQISDPNVLVLGAGGDGNIPIPLLKGTLDFIPVPSPFPQTDLGFYGEPDHGPRERIMAEMAVAVKAVVPTWRYFVGTHKEWKQMMAATAFNLAPRGFGRASFRLAEIVQIGRVPVYLYDDAPWLPYEGSIASAASIGFVGQLGNLRTLLEQLKKVNNDTLAGKLRAVEAARKMYTMEGVLDQIGLFFSDPLGARGGLLRCSIRDHGLASVLDIQLRRR